MRVAKGKCLVRCRPQISVAYVAQSLPFKDGYGDLGQDELAVGGEGAASE